MQPFDSTSRRKKRTTYELGSQERGTATGKPSFVVVQEGDEIDANCDGKNAWDEAIRNFVPKILDMSIVEWEKHPPNTRRKVREALDDEFEYIGHSLSMSGFRTAVTRYMKSERSRLKTRWLSGKEKAPLHINEDQYECLKSYWRTDAQKAKSKKMAAARMSVKNCSAHGRKGIATAEAQVVSTVKP